MMIRFLKILVIIVLSIVIFILIFIPVGLMHSASGSTGGRPLIIAHRGASGVAPENTIPAIDSAISAGADFIEIDVRMSKDGAVVVMHDETADRTTNGKGKISELTLAEILSLDAGSWFGEEFRGTKVPLLEEVVAYLNGRTKLLIEIKKNGNQSAGIEEAVIGIIRKYSAESWCEVQSFNDEVLKIMHTKAPEIGLQKLIVFKYRLLPYVFDGKITRFSIKKYNYVRSVNMHYRFFNKSFSRLIHGSGKKIFLWGCRDEAPCFPINMEGCDGIMTDFPGQVQRQVNLLSR
jgi:glycerophosphoryl diester phosphodiesterase